MIAAYLRVSSTAQDLASQRHAIEQACKARHVIVNDWFEDVMTSRAALRPGLNRLRQFARQGLVSDLFVFKLDRLSRGTICEVLNLLNEFERHGCHVHSIADQFPTEGPLREPILAMLAMCANMERTAIAERVRAARARIEAQGRKWGRPPRVTERQLARIDELRSEGRSVRWIAQAIKVPKTTVGYWCKQLSSRPEKPPVTVVVVDPEFTVGFGG